MGVKRRPRLPSARRPKPSPWNTGPTVLITGASSGIGADLALQFAARGYNLLLHGRDRGRLRALADKVRAQHDVAVRIFVKDLSRPDSARELFREVLRTNVRVDVLVNNAGIGLYGRFDRTPLDRETGMLHLNVLSLLELTKLFLPGMVERGAGRILNVASTAAFQPGPLMAGYYATKAYVLSLSVALAEELKGTGVSVSVLCPGPTPTRFQERAGLADVLAQKLALLSSEEVARITVEKLQQGKRLIVPGRLNKLGTILVRLVPLSLSAAVVKRLQERRVLHER